jgi:hypothetical protein
MKHTAHLHLRLVWRLIAWLAVCGAVLQTEWNAMQLAQLRMTHDKTARKEKKEKKSLTELEDKGRHNKVMKTVSRHKVEEVKSEWDEV